MNSDRLKVVYAEDGTPGFQCLECEALVPVNDVTHCEECGAYFELHVIQTTPPSEQNV